MNILVISNIFPPEVLGGYELTCSGVARALCARGHSVTVLTSGPRGKEDGDVAIDRRLEFTNIYEGEIDATDQILARAINENNAKIIYEQVSQSKCDVVLAFNLLGLGGLQIVDTLNFCEVPWVWYLADSVPGQLMSHLPAELLDLFECSATRTFVCDNAIFVSRRLRMELSEQNVMFRAGISVLPGFVDLRRVDDFNRPPPTDRACSKFVAIGSMSREKGTDLIIETAAKLSASGRQFSVDIYGPGDAKKYRRKIAELGVGAYVRVMGKIEPAAVLSTIGGYDALLFPTWNREPFGLVALEAGAAGLVPIITTGAGVTEVLQEGIDFIGVDRSVESLSLAMTRAMTDPRVFDIAESCRRRVFAEFSIDKTVEAIDQILSETGSKRAPSVERGREQSFLALLETRRKVAEKGVGASRGIAESHEPTSGTELREEAKSQFRLWKRHNRRARLLSTQSLFGRLMLTALKTPLIELLERLTALERNLPRER